MPHNNAHGSSSFSFKSWPRPPKRPIEREEREDRDLGEGFGNSRRRLMEPPKVIPVMPDSRSSQRGFKGLPPRPRPGPRSPSEPINQKSRKPTSSGISQSNAAPLGVARGVQYDRTSKQATALMNTGTSPDHARHPPQLRFNSDSDTLPSLMARMATDDRDHTFARTDWAHPPHSTDPAIEPPFPTESALQAKTARQPDASVGAVAQPRERDRTDSRTVLNCDLAKSLDDRPLVKRDPSPDAPKLEPNENFGVEFFPMLPECASTTVEGRAARGRWRAHVSAMMLKQDRIVTNMRIRPDGMAVDWTKASYGAGGSSAAAKPPQQRVAKEPTISHQARTPASAVKRRAPDRHSTSRSDVLTPPLSLLDKRGPLNTGDKPPIAHISHTSVHELRSPDYEEKKPFLGVYEESITIVAHCFLMQYMRIHDSNRRALRDAYHADARFSDQCWSSSPGRGDASYVPYNPLVAPRTLGAPQTVSAVDATPRPRGFVQGPKAIVDHLLKMRRWAHASPPADLYSRDASGSRFVWDVTLLRPIVCDGAVPQDGKHPSWKTGMMVVCHGDLVDQDNLGIAASFDRTFVIRENRDKVTSDHWPWNILSDQLTIRDFCKSTPWDESTDLTRLSA